MRRPIQELLESNLRDQVRRHVPRAGKICPCTSSVLEQGVTGFDRRARPLGAKALHPVLPVSVGDLGPLSPCVLSDVLILHRLHSNTVFTSRLRTSAARPVVFAVYCDAHRTWEDFGVCLRPLMT